MEYNFKNLATIDEGKIKIEEGYLNVKFGINGTGKSTISQGIVKYINKDDLSDMIKYGADIKPVITANKEFENVIVFNQEYINNYLFKEDLIHNSFEIMINTNEYQQLRDRINNEFGNLINVLEDDIFKNIKQELEEFQKSISIREKVKNGKKTLEITGTSKLARGKKLNDISKLTTNDTKDYEEYLKSEKNFEWIKWFEAGHNLIINDKCPFCLKKLDHNMNTIYDEITNAFKTTTLKQNAESKKILNNIKKFTDEDSKTKIEDICKSNEKFSNEDVELLRNILELCKKELEKLNNLTTLNVITVKEMFESNELVDFFQKNKLTNKFYSGLEIEIQNKIKDVNNIIDYLISKNNEIKKIANEFSSKINALIKDKCEYVNNFLLLSGIPYKIEVIVRGEDDYKTLLKPINANVDIKKEQLSYGEQNAISLLLFSLEAEKNNGLIILDDPVSSFDNNKKFAILYYLFTKENAVFKDKTVLLFTHDFSIIIDLLKKHNFRSMKKYFTHISNKNGILFEKDINDKKVVFTLKQWKKKAKGNGNYLVRIINARKYIEYEICDRDAVDVLSSLLHFDDQPKRSGIKGELIPENKVNDAEILIKKLIPNFSYNFILKEIKDIEKLKQWYFQSNSSIEKIQILRAYLQLKNDIKGNDIFMSFITESYHVENNEFLSLKEDYYDLIPNYIMKLCDKIITEVN